MKDEVKADFNQQFFHPSSFRLHPCSYRLASKTRLKGVSVARRNSLKPPSRTTSRSFSSDATAPSAGPPSASEFGVQQSVEAAEKVRPMPMGSKFPSIVSPAIGSTISALPRSDRISHARRAAPTGSPMSCRQSKKQTMSYPSPGISFALDT